MRPRRSSQLSYTPRGAHTIGHDHVVHDIDPRPSGAFLRLALSRC
jgi:hypothetical protein